MEQLSAEKEVQLVTFRMNNIEFGIAIENVREIIREAKIVRVPKAPSFVEGLINLRGTVVTVIDLRKRLDLPISVNDDSIRVIVVDIDGKIIGLKVDAVSEVLRISTRVIDEMPTALSNIDTKFLEGVGKIGDRLIITLDLHKVLAIKIIDKITN